MMNTSVFISFQTDSKPGINELQVQAIESGFYRCVGRNTDRLEDVSTFKYFYATGTVFSQYKPLSINKNVMSCDFSVLHQTSQRASASSTLTRRTWLLWLAIT